MISNSDASEFLAEPEFVAALNQTALLCNKTSEQAQGYARKCLREIEATPRDAWLRPAAKLAKFVYTRSYEADLDINHEKLTELRELSKDHVLLFLWSHKSHMDSFVFLLSLFENKFQPLPRIFAGINMNFVGFGALARRVGAIFLRRTFQEDAIYKLVFRRYIDFLIHNKMHLSWSIEGTRSRTGKLSLPKLGILNWVVESCQREQTKDVLLIPVSIAFDRIAEINDYVAIQSGEPKRKESLRWFVDYIFGNRTPLGKVYVRYGDPLPLTDYSGATVALPTRSPETIPMNVRYMAFDVCRQIERITPIKSADVLTMVLLGANRRALTVAELYQQSAPIAKLVAQRQLPAASGFSLHSEAEVGAAVLALEQTGLVKCFGKAPVPVYYIPRKQHLAAAYYRNTITHYFLSAALGEIGLAMCVQDIELPSEGTLKQHVMSLRELFKFEFFYESSTEFWQEVLSETNRGHPGWDNGESSLQKKLQEQPPLFGHAILRSITEAYLILTTGLLELNEKPVRDEKYFTRQLLDQGRQMLLRRSISCESAVSQDLFANGLRLAGHLALLDGRGPELRCGRAALSGQVTSTLAAINLLQRAYDSAWFSPSPATLNGSNLEP